jgi:cysteine-S-conjugate beta-lyase
MTHSLETQLLHIGSAPFDPKTKTAPVSLPSVRTSTVRFENLAALDSAMEKRSKGERVVTYGISGLETHRALEEVFLALEEGTYCVLNPSGLASIHLVFISMLSSGDHVLISDGVYGPVRVMNESLLKRLGIEATFFSATRDDVEQLIRPNTRMIYVESPGSLLMEMLDLPKLALIAKAHGVVLATDNTWGSYIYKPLCLGADISLVAGTKYVAGHSDVLLGAVITNRDDLAQKLHQTQYALGNSVSADDVWLALRGVKTMAVRMRQHTTNALAVCEYLDQHPKVSRIYFPAWQKDPGFQIWGRDCSGANGLLTVSLKATPEAAKKVVDRLTLFGIGFSWGGYESLVQWVNPASVAPHSYWSEPGLGLLRLHIGLESIDDIIADLDQALNCLPN